MKRKTITVVATVILAIVVIAGIGAYAASNYGTSSDPLVTMSYITETLEPSIEGQFDAKLNAALEQLENSIAEATSGSQNSYKVVTLSNGQNLSGSVGCEILLRIGTATCSASSDPGLVDMTSGETIGNAASLSQNHLYVVTIEGNGITAGASAVKVLVRGTYTIS